MFEYVLVTSVIGLFVVESISGNNTLNVTLSVVRVGTTGGDIVAEMKKKKNMLKKLIAFIVLIKLWIHFPSFGKSPAVLTYQNSGHNMDRILLTFWSKKLISRWVRCYFSFFLTGQSRCLLEFFKNFYRKTSWLYILAKIWFLLVSLNCIVDM